MADIVLKNRFGETTTYEGVDTVTLPTTNNETVTFIDTSDATATAGDIVSGKTAYVNGEEVTGEYEGIIPSGKKTITNTNETDVTNYASAQVDATGLSSSNIKSGVTILGVQGSVTELNAETKSVSPSASNDVEVTPTSPYNGLSKVTVAQVTSSIDNNIQASNIKNGVTILGVTGNVVELDAEPTQTITPTTSQQTISPSSGYNALAEVVVDGVTSSIDSNITSSNIKSGVNILGVSGSYSGSEHIENAKSVTLTSATETISPSSGYDGIASVEVTAPLGTESVTPTTSAQTITPSGSDIGLSEVTVAAVTSSIDSDITRVNIKKGINILGVNGECFPIPSWFPQKNDESTNPNWASDALFSLNAAELTNQLTFYFNTDINWSNILQNLNYDTNNTDYLATLLIPTGETSNNIGSLYAVKKNSNYALVAYNTANDISTPIYATSAGTYTYYRGSSSEIASCTTGWNNTSISCRCLLFNRPTLNGVDITKLCAAENLMYGDNGTRTLSDANETDVRHYSKAKINTSAISAANIKQGASIFGITGTYTSDANATASDIMNNKTAYVNGSKITGNYVPLDTSGATATAHDILLGKTAFVNGFEVTGDFDTSGMYDTSSATATANDILAGKTAYGASGSISGALDISNLIDASGGTATSADIMDGETAYVGNQLVTGSYVPLDTSDANATADKIHSGYTAYVNGQKITGTYSAPINIEQLALIPVVKGQQLNTIYFTDINKELRESYERLNASFPEISEAENICILKCEDSSDLSNKLYIYVHIERNEYQGAWPKHSLYVELYQSNVKTTININIFESIGYLDLSNYTLPIVSYIDKGYSTFSVLASPIKAGEDVFSPVLINEGDELSTLYINTETPSETMTTVFEALSYNLYNSTFGCYYCELNSLSAVLKLETVNPLWEDGYAITWGYPGEAYPRIIYSNIAFDASALVSGYNITNPGWQTEKLDLSVYSQSGTLTMNAADWHPLIWNIRNLLFSPFPFGLPKPVIIGTSGSSSVAIPYGYNLNNFIPTINSNALTIPFNTVLVIDISALQLGYDTISIQAIGFDNSTNILMFGGFDGTNTCAAGIEYDSSNNTFTLVSAEMNGTDISTYIPHLTWKINLIYQSRPSVEQVLAEETAELIADSY